LNRKTGLHEVLETLAREHGAFISLVAIIDPDSKALQVEAAYGLTRPSDQIRYTVGKGIVGRVAETGRLVIVPRVSREAIGRRMCSCSPTIFWNGSHASTGRTSGGSRPRPIASSMTACGSSRSIGSDSRIDGLGEILAAANNRLHGVAGH
jgi:hypothetical protein